MFLSVTVFILYIKDAVGSFLYAIKIMFLWPDVACRLCIVETLPFSLQMGQKSMYAFSLSQSRDAFPIGDIGMNVHNWC